MRKITCRFATGLVGLFLLLMGLGFLWFGTRSLIRMWAWEKLTLKNNSEAMERWIRPPQPIIFKVFIFNVTNPDEVSDGAPPIFSEVGPYVYEEIRQKVNVTREEGYRLSYKLRNTMRFEPALSGKFKESDLVTVLNAPLAGSVVMVYEAVPEFVGIMDDVWRFFYPGQRNIFITTSVRNLLFDGITIDCTSRVTEVYVACRALASRKTYSVRKEGKNFKFSFFWARNKTSTETYEVDQGVFDLKKSAQFIGIDKSPSMRVWHDQYCNMINGSDGSQFPVRLRKDQKLYIFENDLCRSLYARYEKSIVKSGVTLYKYSATADVFASAKENPDNRCFCRPVFNIQELVQDNPETANFTHDRNSDVCFGNGVLPLMPCVGAPMVVSFPHFYLGDISYQNYSGLNPVKERHETFVYVEPNSGMTVAGYKRIQFNLEIKKVTDVQITSNLEDGIFPILWVEEGTELSDELFKLLKYTLIEIKILQYGTFVLIAVGLLLICGSYLVGFLKEKSLCRTKKKTSKVDDSQMVFLDESDPYIRKMYRMDGTHQKKVLGGVGMTHALMVKEDRSFYGRSLVDNFM